MTGDAVQGAPGEPLVLIRGFSGTTDARSEPVGARSVGSPTLRYSWRPRVLLPQGKWRVLPDLGHVAMSDAPELTARTIMEFAASASERSSVLA